MMQGNKNDKIGNYIVLYEVKKKCTFLKYFAENV